MEEEMTDGRRRWLQWNSLLNAMNAIDERIRLLTDKHKTLCSPSLEGMQWHSDTPPRVLLEWHGLWELRSLACKLSNLFSSDTPGSCIPEEYRRELERSLFIDHS